MSLEKGLKFRIVGVPGSGKTYFSEKMSNDLNIEVLNLDKIFWTENKNKHMKKKDEKERNKNLDEFLKRKHWIIEGVYLNSWCNLTFEQSDYIIVAEVNKIKQYYRIIKRFISRKINKYEPKESITDLKKLILWSFKYKKELKTFLKKIDNEKVVFIKKENDIKVFLKKLDRSKLW